MDARIERETIVVQRQDSLFCSDQILIFFLNHQPPFNSSLFCSHLAISSSYTTTSNSLSVFVSSSLSSPSKTKFLPSLSRFSVKRSGLFSQTRPGIAVNKPSMNLLNKLGFGSARAPENLDSSIPQGPDDDIPAAGQQFAQFGAGCFWGVELAFQRVPGVTKTEVGYTQGLVHNPTYEDVCTGTTNHSEVVRVQYDPKNCSYESLLDLFWARHDPTTLNRQGNDVGTQYRSGIYYYTEEQEKAARESVEQQQKQLNRKIVTEILPAKKFYRAEEYHQQYLEKGGRFGFGQSAAKGCNDPIRCYG
ncbi:peptide methionine sulfoxide reductase A3-like isoform X4 [Vigna umbellata]|uniref:peptide methionine sulfoxide reductase A3-like isoform X4 n=1 Tax=Vigna umbellata TaxID=87088 RepID=UPI001F5EE184|nr:peptide methionine sulfoxide reductase A3-like isoform X4 [Vigna umbellata]